MLHDDLYHEDLRKAQRSCVFEERVAESSRYLGAGNEAFGSGDLATAKKAFLHGLWQESSCCQAAQLTTPDSNVLICYWCDAHALLGFGRVRASAG